METGLSSWAFCPKRLEITRPSSFRTTANSNSRWNRRTASGSRPKDGGNIFSATTRPDGLCRALKTTPNAADPKLVEHQIPGNDQAASLALEQRSRLVSGQQASLDQRPREPGGVARGSACKAFELIGRDKPQISHRHQEFGQVHRRRRPRSDSVVRKRASVSSFPGPALLEMFMPPIVMDRNVKLPRRCGSIITGPIFVHEWERPCRYTPGRSFVSMLGARGSVNGLEIVISVNGQPISIGTTHSKNTAGFDLQGKPLVDGAQKRILKVGNKVDVTVGPQGKSKYRPILMIRLLEGELTGPIQYLNTPKPVQ